MKSMLLWAESLHQKVKENIQKAQTKQKKIYDARHKQPTFQVGDKVWRYNSRKQRDKEESSSSTGMVHMRSLSKPPGEHINLRINRE